MLMVRETYENETEGYVFGESGWQEAYTDDRGELFRALRSEYGGCVSSMYRDVTDAPPIRVGWVFGKNMHYDDDPSGARYMRHVWVEVRDAA